MEHRVLAHLGLAARDYDAVIRRYIPGYEQMVDTIVRLVARRASPLVVDLGAGTGALGAAIAERVPTARVRLLDIDPAMLEVAGARTEAYRDRVELHRGAFEDELPACDVVVASLALHHVPARADKTALFARIRAALRPGGVVLIGDAVVDASGPERARCSRSGPSTWGATASRPTRRSGCSRSGLRGHVLPAARRARDARQGRVHAPGVLLEVRTDRGLRRVSLIRTAGS